YRLYLEAGTPTLDEIAALVAGDDELAGAPARDTVRRCISGAGLPASQADAVAVATVLARRARWDPDDAARRIRESWVQARLHPAEPLRTAAEWNPVRLGIHPAIGVPGHDSDNGQGDPGLTPYLLREHDRQLRTRLAQARDGAASIAVLVGGSSTGKTRSMYEAVTAILPAWPVLVPASARELQDWVAQEAIDAGTMLWLDEAQRYLPAAAAALVTLLERTRPLAVIGGMWPGYWDPLDSSPGPGGQGEVPYVSARILIEPYRPCIRVPERLDAGQVNMMRDLACRDPRLRAAVAAAETDGAVIQHLTGGPALVARYDEGAFTALEMAVITAALDARRLGHATAIPAAFLAEAAAATLDSTQRVTADLNWIDDVLHALCHDPARRVHGALTPLIADRSAPDIGPADGYHPASYLDQHARRARRFDIPGQAFWDAATRHARTPDDLAALAHAASGRLRARHAGRLAQQAAGTGHAAALWLLAQIQATAGHRKQADRLTEKAASAGHATAMWLLAFRLEVARDHEGALHVIRQAPVCGDLFALSALAQMRETAGDREGAELLARQAADAGCPEALWDLAEMREAYGDQFGAERLLEGLMGTRDEGRGLMDAARDPAVAGQLARQALDAGDTWALRMVAFGRDMAGDQEGAERLARQGADAGDPRALAKLAEARLITGDRQEAARLGQLAADAGSLHALVILAGICEETGDREGAERLARRAADAGDTRALADLARTRPEDPRWRQLLRYGLEADGRISDPW
ncbi:MAG: sel1 repeat family protein, partial [Streptosporangiaceae bacterium]|nr:sel1 repeat family protein [Streptosporangiaceae bacterium]